MKISFKKFSKLFLESILSEDKSRLIDRLILPDIFDEEEKRKAKDEMKSFFKKYSNFENKLDWNKLNDITYTDFEKVKELAGQTKGAQKREIASDIKNIFKSVGDRKFEIVGENDNWLFVSPLTWKAAVYCDSSENQGGSAKWCIGYENSDEYWEQYTGDGSLFIMAFNKNYKSMNQRELQINLKYMIEYTTYNTINVWNQADKKIGKIGKIDIFDINKTELIQMFSKVKKVFEKEKENKEKINRMSFEEKIKNLKNITSIPQFYFSNTDKEYLTELEIPDNIKIIEADAFNTFYNLTSVIIPDSVVEIGKEAFAYSSVKNIRLSNNLKKIEKCTFFGCDFKTIEIPDSVETIEEMGFASCKNLETIKLSKNIKYIGPGAFQECNKLKNIEIPEGISIIDKFAFYSCPSLQNIIIPSSIKKIKSDAFSECNKLKNIIFRGKTLSTIKKMANYPWGIKHPEEIIKVEK